jgi:hypothetical protein
VRCPVLLRPGRSESQDGASPDARGSSLAGASGASAETTPRHPKAEVSLPLFWFWESRAELGKREGKFAMRWPSRPVASVFSVALGLWALLPSAAAASPEVFTTVEHNVTLASEFFPDDICGPRAVTETVTNKVQVNHLTANADGGFHFVDFETGTLFSDYVDPAIPDRPSGAPTPRCSTSHPAGHSHRPRRFNSSTPPYGSFPRST